MKARPGREARFVVLRLSSFGDIVLAEPVTRRLKQAYPDCRVDFATYEEYGEIPTLFPGVEARLRERIAEGLADPDLHAAVAAQSLLAMWTRVIAWWVEDPSRAPREAVVETLIHLHPVHTHQRAR